MKNKLITCALLTAVLLGCKKKADEAEPAVSTVSTTTTTGGTSETLKCGTNMAVNKFHNDTTEYSLKEGKSAYYLASSGPGSVSASAKIDGAAETWYSVSVAIGGDKLPTTKTTYKAGNYMNSGEATIGVQFERTWSGNVGSPTGDITIEPNGDGTYTYTADNVKLFNGTDSHNFCFKFTTPACVGCN